MCIAAVFLTLTVSKLTHMHCTCAYVHVCPTCSMYMYVEWVIDVVGILNGENCKYSSVYPHIKHKNWWESNALNCAITQYLSSQVIC